MRFDWSLVMHGPSTPLPTTEEVAIFETSIGYTLPSDYRNFLLSFNGGRVRIGHTIDAGSPHDEIMVSYLYPLTTSTPFLGIVQARELQEEWKQATRQILQIGGDMGTGFFYLLLSGDQMGSVYFVYKDDIPMREGDWYSDEIFIPDTLVKLSSTFDDLGRLILENADPVDE